MYGNVSGANLIASLLACTFIPQWLLLPLWVYRPVFTTWVPPMVASCHYCSLAPSSCGVTNGKPYLGIRSPGLWAYDSSAYAGQLLSSSSKFVAFPLPSLTILLCCSFEIYKSDFGYYLACLSRLLADLFLLSIGFGLFALLSDLSFLICALCH